MLKPALTDSEKVNEYLEKLVHPLKKEMEAVRNIIKNTNPKIAERIKWNAPSYYYKEDLVTFNHRTPKCVHLVFHHPAIVTIQSPILEGDYKDRRMAYFHNMDEVNKHKKELEKIINYLINFIDNQTK